MDENKKTMFQVSIGHSYHDVKFTFDDIQKATELFTFLSNEKLPFLEKVTGDDSEAGYFGGNFKVEIKTTEVNFYEDKKSAEFAVFKGKKEE